MLAKRPRDNIEQILIVIPFKWLLARWWMGDYLPVGGAPQRLFNMTIKCLSFGCYCIFLSLSRGLHCPPSLPPSSHPPFSSFYLSLSLCSHHFICTVRLFAQIKLRLQFSPSQSTYLCFMTRTKSILCCYWSPPPPRPNPHPLITLLLKSTQTIFFVAFCLLTLPHLSCGDPKCMTRCVCVCVSHCRGWYKMEKRPVQKLAGSTREVPLKNLHLSIQMHIYLNTWLTYVELTPPDRVELFIFLTEREWHHLSRLVLRSPDGEK